MPTSPRGVLRLRHWLPGRLRLRAHGASAAETRALAERLGAEWHGWSGSLLLKPPPPLNTKVVMEGQGLPGKKNGGLELILEYSDLGNDGYIIKPDLPKGTLAGRSLQKISKG